MARCKFLKSFEEIKASKDLLDRYGMIHHGVDCKDWDLVNIVPHLGRGNLLDMGSSDSWLLANSVIRGVAGLKLGIDLRPPLQTINGVAFMVGDLMDTLLPPAFFESITCLSVIEHNVDFQKLTAEVDRLLQPGGQLFLTFDYWEPKVVQTVKLYDMDWNILCRREVEELVGLFDARGIKLVEDIDWTLGQPVISGKTWGPPGCIPYTFGLLTLKKN